MGGRRAVAGAVTAGAVAVAACVSDRNVDVAHRADAAHEAGTAAEGTGGARSHKEAGVPSGGAPGRARDGSVDATSGGAADASTSRDAAATSTDSGSRPVRDASADGADAVASGGNTGAGGASNGGTGSGGTPNTGGKGGVAGNSAGGKAGASGAGGAPNTGGKGGAAGSGGGSAGPPCLTAASQAVLMGDSYITGAASPGLQPALVKLDPYAANFRNYAVAGAALGTGGISLIPPQFANAVTANPDIRLVIMVGGGDDIVLCAPTNCSSLCTSTGSSTNSVCQNIVQKAVDALTTLTTSMANAGVHDLIYYLYPHIPSAGPGGAGYSEILDYSESRLKTACDGTLSRTGGKLTCHFVDLVAPFAAAGGDENPANFYSDGLHPSDVGQDIIATQLYKAMKASCIGFTAADAAKNACTCK